jgi:hypothetical protein
MLFGEDVIEPTLHLQQDARDNGKHLPVLGMGGDLTDGAGGQIVAGQIIEDFDIGKGVLIGEVGRWEKCSSQAWSKLHRVSRNPPQS